jgi:DNA processing protein
MPAAETPSSISTSAGELEPWLRLQLTPGAGPVAARRLLAAFGLPQHIFSATFAQLRAVVPDALVRALLAPPSAACAGLLARTRSWLDAPGHAVLTLADSAYPPLLLHLPDPPLLLYVSGDPALLAQPALAIVGSRGASVQGARDAARFAEALCEAGLTIVSGLARGIDAAAHQGALRAASPAGGTVAVVGTGCDIVYPPRNRALAAEIAAHGCVVSEYPLGTPPLAANFPRRNRLIAGLSRAVLVIEAAERSGSLITARLAAEQGRDVFALPGSIHAPLARGCHRLIKEGARLTETPGEILEELGLAAPAARPPAAAPLPGLLDFAPADFDTLANRSGLSAAALNAALLGLEMAGQAERLPDGKYRRLF